MGKKIAAIPAIIKIGHNEKHLILMIKPADGVFAVAIASQLEFSAFLQQLLQHATALWPDIKKLAEGGNLQ